MTLSDFLRELQVAGAELDFEHLRDAFWLAKQGRELSLGGPAPRGLEEITPPPDDGAGSFPPAPGESPVPFRKNGTPKPKEFFQPGVAPALGLRPARRVSSPAAQVIGDRLAMTRSMRPFRRPWRSPALSELDEEETAERSAEAAGRVWPVFRAGRERWFEVELVLEDDPAIALWDEVAAGFLRILGDSGAFRSVRRWRLCAAGSAEPQLQSPAGQSFAAHRLGDGSVRRLILFVTHGASRNWANGVYASILGAWRARAGVAIMQAMPRHQWDRTPLGKPLGVCAAIAPGDPTARFWSEHDWWEAPLDDEPAGDPYPLIPFSAPAIADWASMQMGRGRRLDAVFLRTLQEGECADALPQADPYPQDTEFVVSLLKSESQQAFDLAVYLSQDPFSIPFARRVQEAMFGRQADPSCLAELLFGGLVERIPSYTKETHYAFTEQAVEILSKSIEASRRVLIVADVFRRVSEDLGKFANRIVHTEDLLVRDEHGSELLPDWVLAVACVTSETGELAQAPPFHVAFFGNPPHGTAAAIASVLAKAENLRVITSAEQGADRVAAALAASRSGADDDGVVRTERLWDQQLGAIVWLGDAPPPQKLADDAREHDIPLVPLAGSGMYAIQVLYGREGEPDGRDVELSLLTDRLLGILRQLGPNRGGAGPFQELARCILALLSSAGAETGNRQEHPRIPIYRAGLLAAAGAAASPSAESAQARLAELAEDNAAWLMDNLLALDGISDAWPAGRHAQAIIIWALLQAKQDEPLRETLAMLRSAAAHADTPLRRVAVKLNPRLGFERDWSPRRIEESLDQSLDLPRRPSAGDSAARAAYDFLNGQTVPAWMQAFRRLEAIGEHGRVDDEAVVSLVRSADQFERVQGYVHARYQTRAEHWPLWAEMLQFETDELGTSQKPDTRLIWLLFLAIKAHLSKPLPKGFSRDRVEDGLLAAQARLVGPPDIDEGGECKTLLAELRPAFERSGPANTSIDNATAPPGSNN